MTYNHAVLFVLVVASGVVWSALRLVEAVKGRGRTEHPDQERGPQA